MKKPIIDILNCCSLRSITLSIVEYSLKAPFAPLVVAALAARLAGPVKDGPFQMHSANPAILSSSRIAMPGD
jgi:hypothetical protein